MNIIKGKNNIMIDLETLGTKPGAIIMSVGAVRFDNENILDSFYELIDPVDQSKYGAKIDIETVFWWLQQNGNARKAAFDCLHGLPMIEVLKRFRWFVQGSPDTPYLWGNGADFDCVLLSYAYEMAGMDTPWAYYQHRCFRTIRKVFPDIEYKKPDKKQHIAIYDAKAQAEHMIKINKKGR